MRVTEEKIHFSNEQGVALYQHHACIVFVFQRCLLIEGSTLEKKVSHNNRIEFLCLLILTRFK